MNYQIYRSTWIGDYVDPNSFLDLWVTGAANNQTGWSNPEYDRLIAEAGQTGDQAARYTASKKQNQSFSKKPRSFPSIFTRTPF